MQHLDTEPTRKVPGIPRINIPWKSLAMLLFGFAILAVLGILLLDNSDMHAQLSAAQASIQFLNDSKANREGVLLQFSLDNSSISRLTENVTQLQKLVVDPSTTLAQFNSSLQDTRDQLRTISNLYSVLHSEVVNISEKCSNCIQPAVSQVQNTTTDSRSCREKILDLHGLGSLFDIVYCCESRAYGFADECCACYK